MHGSHHHGHSHGDHGHSHAPTDFGRAFAIGTALNLTFVLIEGTAGILTDSMALLADAGHNLSNVLGLLIAWGRRVARQAPGLAPFYTYGFRSSTILAALDNAVLLLFAVGAIALKTVRRFADPPPVGGDDGDDRCRHRHSRQHFTLR